MLGMLPRLNNKNTQEEHTGRRQEEDRQKEDREDFQLKVRNSTAQPRLASGTLKYLVSQN